MQIKRIDNISSEEWDAMVKKSKHGTIFHTDSWLKILYRNFDCKPIKLMAVNRGRDIIGIFPIYKFKKHFFKIRKSPFPDVETPYGGPLALNGEVINLFMEEIKKTKGSHYFIFSPTYNFNKDFKNYKKEKLKTFILDLTPNLDDLWKNLDKKARNEVRKAKKNNVTIFETKESKFINDYYQMLYSTFKRTNANILPKKFYLDIFETFKEKNQVKLVFAKYKNKLISGAMFLIFKGRINYWTGASLKEFLSLNPNNLIQWYIIKWAKENNLKEYDLQGANIPRIAKFKSGWGGKLVEYPRYVKKTKIVTLSLKIISKFKK